jgi:hypothetical protein
VDDNELAAQALTIDPTRSTIVLLLGMKGRGKSSAARKIFDAWPLDRLVVDPTGNARPDDPDTVALAAPFPSQLPEPDEHADPPQTRVTVWARINPGSPTLKFDQDQATNMALHPRSRRKLIWRDEFGLGTSAQTTSDADRTLLMSSRHYNVTALLVVQRPRNIPVLALSQADLVLVWSLPNPDDREHVAKNAGIPVSLFERQYADNQRRGRHSYLLFDREHDVLLNCPQLPGVEARGPKA